MKSVLLGAISALSILVLPTAGHATEHGPYRWFQSQYTGVPETTPNRLAVAVGDPPVQTNQVSLDVFGTPGDTFTYYGVPYATINVGTKGYISFGSDLATATPDRLTSATGPATVIAAWWGDHYCNPQSIYSSLVGLKPSRVRSIQWHCATTNSDTAETTFRVMIKLFEDSSVIQVHYDKINAKGDQDWTNVRVGIKGPGGPPINGIPCSASTTTAACKRADFPSNHVIQYGAWENDSDLIATTTSTQAIIDAGETTATISLKGEIRNIGKIAVPDASYTIYLSTGNRPYSQANGDRVVYDSLAATGVREAIDGLGTLLVDRQEPGVPLPPPGKYFVCLFVESLKAEVTKANNFGCLPTPLIFGADLTGSVTGIPTETRTMEPFPVTLKIRNIGNLTMETNPDTYLTYTLAAHDPGHSIKLMRSDGLHWRDNADFDEFIGQLQGPFPPGAEVTQTVYVKMPFTENNNTRDFAVRLTIGLSWSAPAGNGEDADPDNNVVYSSSTSGARKTFKYLLPHYEIRDGGFDVQMPFGCTFGEPARGSMEICNNGDVEGYAFWPRLHYASGAPGQSTVGSGMNFDAGIGPILFPSCMVPEVGAGGLWTEVQDPSICATGDICALGACRRPCDPDSSLDNQGCDPGFRCVDDPYLMQALGEGHSHFACVPYVEAGECFTYDFDGTVPVQYHELDEFAPQSDPPYPAYEDLTPMMPKALPNSDQSPEVATNEFDWDDEVESIICHVPKADIIADGLPFVPDEVVAGQSFYVERSIINDGTVPVDVEFGYYLSPVPDVSPNQWIVPVIASNGGLGQAWLDRSSLMADWSTTPGKSRNYDTVLLPDLTPPGDYWFGLVVDPNGKIMETTKSNNTFVLPRKVRVHAATLRIESSTTLPPGTVDVRYNWSLWASGGTGAYQWEKGKSFPSWLDLDPTTGHLSGTPTEERDYIFDVKVRSGNVFATRSFALRIYAPEGPLWIPPHVFPLAVRNQHYPKSPLKANGGSPPYKWTLITEGDSALPIGFCFRAEGDEHGHPFIESSLCTDDKSSQLVPPTASTRAFHVRVTDSRGATATAELKIQVSSGAELQVALESLPPAEVNRRYDTGTGLPKDDPRCIAAQGGSQMGYDWVVSNLPAGMGFETRDDRACLDGTPKEWGLFMVQVTVTDLGGLKASKSLPLEVYNISLELSSTHLGEVVQGSAVDEKLGVLGIHDDVTMTVTQGRLPSGLDLTPDGWVRGMVGSGAEPGTYTVSIELRSPSGQFGISPLSIRVKKVEGPKEKPDEGDTCGSSATGGSAASGLPLGMALLGLIGMLRTNRRREGTN